MTITHTQRSIQPFRSRFFSALTALFRRVREQRQRHRSLKDSRAAFMNLVYQDNRILDDIGVNRDEVQWATSLPLEINAALALRERALSRRRTSG